MAEAHLDLATLNILLQRVRRHPRDRSLRLVAARHVALLADHEMQETDKLLHEMIPTARMLRRALDRANSHSSAPETDIAALSAWIDKLQGPMLRAISR